MASAGGGTDGAAGTIKKKKRISDCLVDSDGGEEDAAPPSPPSPGTPRLRIPMFTCARLRFVRLGKKGGGGRGRKDVVVSEKSEAASTDSSGWKQESKGGASTTEAAGMGLSLLFLLAKTCVELNKMAEVRAQMEALLEEMRDLQLARTTKISTDSHAAAPESATRDLQASTTTTASPCRCRASARTGTDGRVGAASSSSPEPYRPRRFHPRTDESSFYALTGNPLFDLDRAAASTSGMETASGESGTSSDMEDSMSMTVDVAGAQFQLNNNNNTEQETPESSSDGESFIELEGGFGAGAGAGVGNSARPMRGSNDGHEEDEEERGSDEGVSALDLERRLQELLHRRSRERIEELETSLRRAERKLMEKEMEARLWKDTAKLALQPPQQDGAATSSH